MSYIEEPSHKWKGFFEDLRNRPTTGLPNPPLKGWDCGMAIVQAFEFYSSSVNIFKSQTLTQRSDIPNAEHALELNSLNDRHKLLQSFYNDKLKESDQIGDQTLWSGAAASALGGLGLGVVTESHKAQRSI